MNFDLTVPGKTFLITGATSGVGRGIALGLGRLGANLILIGRDEAGLLAMASRLAREFPGPKYSYFSGDLSTLSGVEQLESLILGAVTRLDGIVHGAGTLSWQKKVSAAGVEMSWALNFLGACRLTQGLYPLLKKSPRPRVAMVAGASASLKKLVKDFGDSSAPYNAVKAVVGAAQAKILWSMEAAKKWPDVDVITFHPGFVKTSMINALPGPVKLLASLGNLFLSEECPEGVWAAADPTLHGKSGVFVENRRVWDTFPWVTEELQEKAWAWASGQF